MTRCRLLLALALWSLALPLRAQVLSPDGTFQVAEPTPGAPTAALVATTAGACTAGAHVFGVTNITAAGETIVSPWSNVVTCDSTHTQVLITFATPMGSPAVIARNVWASAANSGGPLVRVTGTLPVVPDATSTTYTFTSADSGLSPVPPPSATTSIGTTFKVDPVTGHVVSTLGFDTPNAGALGNLNGFYGYNTAVYGAAFGSAAGTNVTMDATNGFRVRTGTTNLFQADASGNLSLVGDLNIGTAGDLRSGATAYATGVGLWTDYNAGTPRFRIGDPAGRKIQWDGSDFTFVSSTVTINSTGLVGTGAGGSTISVGPAVAGVGGAVVITGGTVGLAAGGPVSITAGGAGAPGLLAGGITLTAGSNTAAGLSAGGITLTAGSNGHAVGTGGAISILGGVGGSVGGGGSVTIGGGTGGPTGNILLTPGNVGIGTTPAARLHSLATTEQLRLGYDTSNYLSATVSSVGSLTLAVTGTNPNLILTPGGTGGTGIGTTAPYDLLEVSKNTAAGLGGRILVSNLATKTIGNEADLAFKLTNDFVATVYTARIADILTNTTTFANDLVVYLYDAGANGGTEKMRLLNSGRLNTVGGYNVGGVAGVSCTVNVPAHLTVVNGIVTLCN